MDQARTSSIAGGKFRSGEMTFSLMNRKSRGTTFALICYLIATVNCTTVVPPAPANNVSPVVAAASGTPQSHAVDGAFGTPMVATVTTNGSPTSGVVVTFTAPASGASGKFSDTNKNVTTATTDSSGMATAASFAANAMAGSYTVTASISGATPAPFTLTNTTGAPAAIIATSGNGQSVRAPGAFPSPLVASVMDGGQNPVSNAIVTFTAPSSGASGTFADSGTNTTTAMTNASGTATSTVFTANSSVGPDAVTATVGGVSTPASFNLMNLSGPPVAITAASGTPQGAAINKSFSAPLVAAVTDSNSNPVSGAAVTFTAPASTTSPSGTFANGTNAETDTTDVSGMATSTVFTANSVSGGPYTVTASVAGVSTPANFSLTNQVPNGTYVFYLSGQEASYGPNFYALAGAVQITAEGAVLGGEQDYNDGEGINASPQPTGDMITGGSLAGNTTTGLGTLTLITNNPNLGVGGTETLGIQFVTNNHLQIIQFDGSATSSGSMDLQTLPASLTGGFAFTLTGVDPSYTPVGFGGVFSISGGTTLQNGFTDTNDNGTVVLGTALSGTISPPDHFGRGSIVGFANPVSTSTLALNYYIVGPETLRLIDVDNTSSTNVFTNDSAIGSAFGQGTNATAATNASLGTSVFGVAGSPYPTNYGAVGMFSTSSSAGTFSGVADDDELPFGVLLSATPISGTYSIQSNGYGSLTISPGVLGDVSALGIYLTDPTLNLTNPNSITGPGGAIVVDLDPSLSGGAGIVIPQTDTSTSSFAGNYAFGAQAFFAPYEFDFVGQGSMKSGVFTGTGEVSDPFITLGGNATNPDVAFSGAPLPDTSNVGRYTLFSTNTVPNPLNVTISGTTTSFDVALYQASGAEVLWLNEDFSSVFFGSMQHQGSLSKLPVAGPVAPATRVDPTRRRDPRSRRRANSETMK